MIYGVSRHLIEELEKIYRNIPSGEELCPPGCYKCCGELQSSNKEIVYITFLEIVYMISGLKPDRLSQITSKSKLTQNNPTFCRFLEVKNGMGRCIVYPKRPWDCRVFKGPPGKCDYNCSKKDIDARDRITELNNQISGKFSFFKEFGRMPIEFWLDLILSK